jgi:hypothetical protein
LREVGWSKATELVKVARKDGERFDCATWLHRAEELPKEGFKTEVERYLTGKETEPWEIIYFKMYKSRIPVVEQALETVALMLGSGKSRGYCLEMICADFLAGSLPNKTNLRSWCCPWSGFTQGFLATEEISCSTDYGKAHGKIASETTAAHLEATRIL